MKDFLFILGFAIYQTRYKLYALAITCIGWIAFASSVEHFVGKEYLDLLVYALVGWYWLGQVVMPWVESKLEQIFDL